MHENESHFIGRKSQKNYGLAKTIREQDRIRERMIEETKFPGSLRSEPNLKNLFFQSLELIIIKGRKKSGIEVYPKTQIILHGSDYSESGLSKAKKLLKEFEGYFT